MPRTKTVTVPKAKKSGAVKRGRPKGSIKRFRLESLPPEEANRILASSNRLMLKSLRTRAGVSSKECAEALGMESMTGYLRYENDKRFDAAKIPVRVIKPLIGLLVGRGVPPVTEAELLAVSEMDTPPAVPAPISAPRDVITRQSLSMPGDGQREQLCTVPIRYRLEVGTAYRASDQSRYDRHYGQAPFVYSSMYPVPAQWACRIDDSHADKLGCPPGSIVHCVDVQCIKSGWHRVGRLFPVSRVSDGLEERVFANCDSFEETDSGDLLAVCHLLQEGQPFRAKILGVPLYVYAPMIGL